MSIHSVRAYKMWCGKHSSSHDATGSFPTASSFYTGKQYTPKEGREIFQYKHRGKVSAKCLVEELKISDLEVYI